MSASLLDCRTDAEVGAWVRNEREAAGFSQAVLAERVGALGVRWWPVTVSKIEGGRRHLLCTEIGPLLEALGTTETRAKEQQMQDRLLRQVMLAATDAMAASVEEYRRQLEQAEESNA